MPSEKPPGLLSLLQRCARTGSGALQNRFELLSIEWQQERARLTALLFWSAILASLGLAALVLLTGTILFLLPQEYRVWGAAGFTVLYIAGAAAAAFALKKTLREDPFPETLHQLKQDGVWLDSFTTRN
jgi:uncharacterized membrane protein YqjE